MGRSRGGLTTKIHALVDASSLPIALKLTEGQAHDGRAACDMLGSSQAGDILLADRAYDSDALREDLKIPENFLVSVKLASARIWMRFNKSMA